MKRWKMPKITPDIVTTLQKGTGVSPLGAKILAARGYTTAESVQQFLNVEELSNPLLFVDMCEAADRITEAVDMGEKICVYGDYDCDGVMSTVILFSYLQNMGADVIYRIPERSDGYGLHNDMIQELADQGVELLVTVDNGITAHSEIDFANSLGMTVIVTDHHQPLETLPDAFAVVDPARTDETAPFRSLCGAGVALQLVAAMENGDDTIAFEEYGDLAAIATVADVVMLTGENRYIVSEGLKLLQNTERPGLRALMEIAHISGKELTATNIAFQLAPRVNAAGRYGTPLTAVSLLLTEEEEKAQKIAIEIDKRNTARKSEEENILHEIEARVAANPETLYDRVLVFAGKNWHHGVIGIVAARLQEKFGKPAILITISEDIARGSMRSFGSFSSFRCLDACADFLTQYGGHPAAGGFSLLPENIDLFHKAVEAYAQENFPDMPQFTYHVDGNVRANDLTIPNVLKLSSLEPFGEGNPTPYFALVKAKLKRIIPLSNGNHTKLEILFDGKVFELLLFRTRPEDFCIPPNTICDFLVTAEIHEFRGAKNLSLIIQDYRCSGVNQQRYFAASSAYEKYMRGEPLAPNLYPSLTPSITLLREIYRYIPTKSTNIDGLFGILHALPEINYGRFRIALDMFAELKLAEISLWAGTVRRLPTSGKVNLEASNLLCDIRKKGE